MKDLQHNVMIWKGETKVGMPIIEPAQYRSNALFFEEFLQSNAVLFEVLFKVI